MKKILVILIALLVVGRVLAATEEAGIEEKQVKRIREKIEQQTKKLKDQVEKVVSGFVRKISSDEFLFEGGEKIKIDNELTRYFAVKKNKLEEIEKEDIREGDYVFAVGPELEGTINVLEVYKDEKYKVLSGVVLEIDKKNYFLRVLTELKTEKLVDIEKKTKQLVLQEKSFEFKRTRFFSKIKEGDYVIFVYRQEQAKEKERVSAYKILIIPQELVEALRAAKVK